MTSQPIPARPLDLPVQVPTQGPLVSVLIPTWDNQAHIAGCLGSALLQSYRSVEIIVLDDGSSDSTVALASALAASDGRASVHRNPERVGIPATMLRLLEMCSGEFVTILNACDQFCDLNAVAVLATVLTGDPGISLASGYSGSLDWQGVPTTGVFGKIAALPPNSIVDGRMIGNLLLQSLADRFVFVRSGVLFRRDRLGSDERETIGGLRPGPSMNGELIWWLNLLSRGDAALVDRMLTQVRFMSVDNVPRLGRGSHPYLQWPTGSPLQWPAGLLALMEGAERLGYLRDEDVKRTALHSVLRRAADALLVMVGFDFELPELRLGDLPEGGVREWTDWAGALRKVIGEIARLSSHRIGSNPRDVITTGPRDPIR